MAYDYAKAYQEAVAKGDTEAAAYFQSKLQPSGAAQQPAPMQGSGHVVPVAPDAQKQPSDSASAQQWGGGRLGRFIAGLGDSGIKSYLGLKQLTVGLDEEEKNVLKLMSEDSDQDGGWRTGGQVVGELAQTAIPAAKLSKAAAFTKLGKTAAPIAASGTVSAAQEGLLAPTTEEGRDLEGRAINAAKAGIAGAGLAAGGKVLVKTVKGLVTPSAEAKTLMAAGITPKIQEGADSGFGRFVGRLTQGAIDPENIRERREVALAIAKRIAPGRDFSGYKPPELVGALKDTLDTEYDRILSGKTFSLSKPAIDAVRNTARRAGGSVASVRARVEQELDDILGATRNPRNLVYKPGQPGVGLSRYREKFQQSIDDLIGSGDVDQRRAGFALQKAKARFDEIIRSQLTPDEQTALKVNDEGWKMFVPFRKAVNSATGSREFSPARIVEASKRGNSIAMSSYPNADILDPANRIFQKGGEEGRRLMVATARALGAAKIGGGATAITAYPMAAPVLGPLYAASLLGQTGKGSRFLYGQNELQKQLADKLRKVGPYLSGAGALPNYNQE